MQRPLYAGSPHSAMGGLSIGDDHPQYTSKTLTSLLLGPFVSAADPRWNVVPGLGDMTSAFTKLATDTSIPAGSTVIFKPGTYVFSGPLVWARALNIYAYGATFSFGATNLGANAALTVGDTSSTQIRQVFVEGLSISRTYTFDLDTVSAGPGTGIAYIGFQAIACNRCVFRDLQVEGFSRGYYFIGRNGVTGAGFAENVIDGCRALNCRYSLTLEQSGADAFVNENDFYNFEHQHSTSFSSTHCLHPTYGIEMCRLLWAAVANRPNNNRFWGCNWEAPSTRPAYRKVRVEGSENGWYHCRWETHPPTIYAASVTSVAAPGAGYVLGDTITLTGGTFSTATVLQVTGVVAGGVTSAVIVTPGTYTVAPGNPVAQGSTSGVGAGATFNMSYVTGYDITVGKTATATTFMTRNVFAHGMEMNAIVDNTLMEFIGTTTINNKNQFFSGWSSIWAGGNNEPAISMYGGGDQTDLFELRKVTGAAERTLLLRAGGPSAEHGFIGFYDNSTTRRNYLSLSTSPLNSIWNINVDQGLTVGNKAQFYPGAGDELIAFPLPGAAGGRIVFAGNGAFDVPPLAAKNSSSTQKSFGVYTAADVLAMSIAATPTDKVGEFVWYQGGTDRNRLWMDDDSPFEVKIKYGLTVNDDAGASGDFTVIGDTDAATFVVDVSADSVGIGTAAPAAGLDVRKQAKVHLTSTSAFLVEDASSNPLANFDTDSRKVTVTGNASAIAMSIDQGELSCSEGLALLGGNLRLDRRPVTGNFNIPITEHMIASSSGGAARTLTLPAANSNPEMVVFIKDASYDANTWNLIIASTGGDTIDNAASPLTLTVNGSKVLLISDGGTNWERYI